MQISAAHRERIHSAATTAAHAVKDFALDFGDGFGSEFHTSVDNLRIVGKIVDEHGVINGAKLVHQGMKAQGPGNGVKDAILGTFVRPVVNDFKAHEYGHATGRLAFYVVTAPIPGDKELRAAAAILAQSQRGASSTV